MVSSLSSHEQSAKGYLLLFTNLCSLTYNFTSSVVSGLLELSDLLGISAEVEVIATRYFYKREFS